MGNSSEKKYISELVEDMHTPIEGAKYYAITVTADEKGDMRISTQTSVTRWTSGSPRREIRNACEVRAQKMLELWADVGVPGLVLNSSRDVAVFSLIGGNAVIEASLARKFIPGFFDDKEYVPTGLGTSAPVDLVEPDDFRRAPTPKLRMKILKRDGYRCRICGRRAEDNTDIIMNVHHFIPAEIGGLSNESNLVTLCHTCHNGLEPHFDMQLAEVFPETHTVFNKNIEEALNLREDYREGVSRYRKMMKEKRENSG